MPLKKQNIYMLFPYIFCISTYTDFFKYVRVFNLFLRIQIRCRSRNAFLDIHPLKYEKFCNIFI